MRVLRLAEWVPAAVLVGAAVGALLWHFAALDEASAGRAAARAALVQQSTTSGLSAGSESALKRPGARARAQYWQSVAALVRALDASATGRRPQLAQLRSAAEQARRGTASGPPGARSKAWSVLALTRLARAVLADPAKRGSYVGGAIAALRRAVALDPRNAEAKANLEVLLQLTPPPETQQAPGTKRGRSGALAQPGAAQAGASVTATTPAAGY